MRIQIVELPTQHVGEARTSPYLLVISEVDPDLPPNMPKKDGFDHCAGVIMTTDHVRVGEESAYELQRREGRQEQRRIDALLAEHKLLPGSILAVDVSLMEPEKPVVDCPEQYEGRHCACIFGAQDCPVNGKFPASIGVMDIAHEDRAVTVTENEGGTRVAHIAIDVDQTPEELASDVAAIVEEQREQQSCRGDSHCPAQGHVEGCFREAREHLDNQIRLSASPLNRLGV